MHFVVGAEQRHRAVNALAVKARQQARHHGVQRRARDEEVNDEAREHRSDEACGPLLRVAQARLRQEHEVRERVDARKKNARDGRNLEEEVEADGGACARRLGVRADATTISDLRLLGLIDSDASQHLLQAQGLWEQCIRVRMQEAVAALLERTKDHGEVKRHDADLCHDP